MPAMKFNEVEKTLPLSLIHELLDYDAQIHDLNNRRDTLRTTITAEVRQLAPLVLPDESVQFIDVVRVLSPDFLLCLSGGPASQRTRIIVPTRMFFNDGPASAPVEGADQAE